MRKIFPNLITIVAFAIFSIVSVGSFEYNYFNLSDKLFFVVEMETSSNGTSQVFFDTGLGFNEKDSYKIQSGDLQKYSFPIPATAVKSIRFDPPNVTSVIRIKKASIENKQGNIIKKFSLQDFKPISQIDKIFIKKDILNIKTVEDAKDPIIILENSSIERQFVWTEFLKKRWWIIIGYSLISFLLLIGLNYFIIGKLEQYKEEIKHFRNGIGHNIINPNEKYLWLLFALFSSLYFFTYINANNYLLTHFQHDDALFFRLGLNISEGNWLGPYMELTLAKVPAFAMFLAVIIKTGISYLWLISICNIIAVSFLLIKSKYLFGNTKILLLILGIMLLFNPIFATHLRIYRSQLSAISFIIFIASLISIFNPESKKSHWATTIADILIISIAWGILWFSREEYLFYVGCLFIALIAFFLVRKFISNPIRNLYPIFYGISGVVIFWLFISSMNYKHYDRFVVCEKTSAPYTSAIKTFNSIADPDFPQNISGSAASIKKIRKVAKEIPLFRPMSKNLIASAKTWIGIYFDKNKLVFETVKKNALTISHFEWAWIDAVATTGYYKNATTLSYFYTELNKQMIKAISEGRLSTKKGNLVQVGPYSLSKTDITTILKLLPKNYFKLLPSSKNIAKNYQNLLIKKSPVQSKSDMKIWKEKLNIDFIAEGNNQLKPDSLSNKIWNIIITIWAYTAMPLIHLSTILAFIALIISVIRKRWAFFAIIVTLSSVFVAHYLMLSTVSVISSYDAASQAYFLPSYATILITAILSISVIINIHKKPQV